MDNRTHFLILAKPFEVVSDELLVFDYLKVLNHEQNPGADEDETIFQWNEDGLILDFQFHIDNTKVTSINSLVVSFIATDGTNSFNLDSLNVTLTPNLGAPPAINTNLLRGYVLPSGSNFNKIELIQGATVGSDTYYSGVVGQKIPWQEWIRNTNAPAIFANFAQQNNGLNQKTDNYSNENGYTIHAKVIVNVSGNDSIQGAVTNNYEQLSSIITVFDYDESDDDVIIDGLIETFDETGTYDLGGVYLTNEPTLFRTTWAGTDPLDAGDVGYIIHRIERENAAGNHEIEEISTLRGAVAGGKLSDLTYYQSGDNIVSECLISAGLSGNWKLSSRIKTPAMATGFDVAFCDFIEGPITIYNVTTDTELGTAVGSYAADMDDIIRITVDLELEVLKRISGATVNGTPATLVNVVTTGDLGLTTIKNYFEFTVSTYDEIVICLRYAKHSAYDQEYTTDAGGFVVSIEDRIWDLSASNPAANNLSQGTPALRPAKVAGSVVFTGTESLELTGYTHAGANSYAFWVGETVQATNPIDTSNAAHDSLQYTCFDFGQALHTINVHRSAADTARFTMYNKKQRDGGDLTKTRHVSYVLNSSAVDPNQLLMFEGGVTNANQVGVPFGVSNAQSYTFRNSGGVITSGTLIYNPTSVYGAPMPVTGSSVTIGNINPNTEIWDLSLQHFGGGGYIGDFKYLIIICELARTFEINEIRTFLTTRYL